MRIYKNFDGERSATKRIMKEIQHDIHAFVPIRNGHQLLGSSERVCIQNCQQNEDDNKQRHDTPYLIIQPSKEIRDNGMIEKTFLRDSQQLCHYLFLCIPDSKAVDESVNYCDKDASNSTLQRINHKINDDVGRSSPRKRKIDVMDVNQTGSNCAERKNMVLGRNDLLVRLYRCCPRSKPNKSTTSTNQGSKASSTTKVNATKEICSCLDCSSVTQWGKKYLPRSLFHCGPIQDATIPVSHDNIPALATKFTTQNDAPHEEMKYTIPLNKDPTSIPSAHVGWCSGTVPVAFERTKYTEKSYITQKKFWSNEIIRLFKATDASHSSETAAGVAHTNAGSCNWNTILTFSIGDILQFHSPQDDSTTNPLLSSSILEFQLCHIRIFHNIHNNNNPFTSKTSNYATDHVSSTTTRTQNKLCTASLERVCSQVRARPDPTNEETNGVSQVGIESNEKKRKSAIVNVGVVSKKNDVTESHTSELLHIDIGPALNFGSNADSNETGCNELVAPGDNRRKNTTPDDAEDNDNNESYDLDMMEISSDQSISSVQLLESQEPGIGIPDEYCKIVYNSPSDVQAPESTMISSKLLTSSKEKVDVLQHIQSTRITPDTNRSHEKTILTSNIFKTNKDAGLLSDQADDAKPSLLRLEEFNKKSDVPNLGMGKKSQSESSKKTSIREQKESPLCFDNQTKIEQASESGTFSASTTHLMGTQSDSDVPIHSLYKGSNVLLHEASTKKVHYESSRSDILATVAIIASTRTQSSSYAPGNITVDSIIRDRNQTVEKESTTENNTGQKDDAPKFVLYFLEKGIDMSRLLIYGTAKIEGLKRHVMKRGAAVIDTFDKAHPPWPTHIVVSEKLVPEVVVESLGFQDIDEMSAFLGEQNILCVTRKWATKGNRIDKPPLQEPTMMERYLGIVPSSNKQQPEKKFPQEATTRDADGPADRTNDRKDTKSTSAIEQDKKPKLPPQRNQKISELFRRLSKLHQECPLLETDEWRSYSFQMISGRLRYLDFDVIDDPNVLRRLQKIKGFGSTSMQIIKEFLETGTTVRLREFEIDPRRVAMRTFMNIWGVGRVRATELVNAGYKTIGMVRNAVKTGILKLDRNQYIGLMLYEDLLEEMTRTEVETLADIVFSCVRERYPSAEITIMGSYRRGKQTCGDVDIMITHHDYEDTVPPRALGQIVDDLKSRGQIAHHLTFVTGMKHEKFESLPRHVASRLSKPTSYGRSHDKVDKFTSSSWMGIFHSPTVDGKYRRVDIKFYPFNERIYAALYFTGNGHFNRSMRLWATRKYNWQLSDHGLIDKNTNRSVMDHVPDHEREIFDKLNLVWKEPSERDCFDAVECRSDGSEGVMSVLSNQFSKRDIDSELKEHIWVK